MAVLRRGARSARVMQKVCCTCQSAAAKWKRGPGRGMLVAWHRLVSRERSMTVTGGRVARRWEKHCRIHRLKSGTLGFKMHAGWEIARRRFRSTVLRRRGEEAMRLLVLPAWRAAAVTPRRVQRLCGARRRMRLQQVLNAWRAASQRQEMLHMRGCRAVAKMNAGILRFGWLLWLDCHRLLQRSEGRGRLVAARHRHSTCRHAMDVWRLLLRERLRTRRKELAADLDAHRGDLKDARNAEVATKPADPTEWFRLTDALHASVREAAEGSVELEEAEAQGTAIRSALAEKRSEAQALVEYIVQLRNSKLEDSIQCGKKQEVVEEELSRVLGLQGELRVALRWTAELCHRCRETIARSETQKADLQRELDDSERICAELVKDRNQKLADFEAWSKRSGEEVARLEEDLEQQQTFARLQQGELQRRQRCCGLVLTHAQADSHEPPSDPPELPPSLPDEETPRAVESSYLGGLVAPTPLRPDIAAALEPLSAQRMRPADLANDEHDAGQF
eukprot:gnl/TRDRNA2_/TRDRNA2_153447_c0_seq2.p1 gnl/TRDRNA2_/TRDRNA2_153447_c0~~gnl/TRDRNA2_/TRDRNA2_153447_c0_seq2.p1  ORF type:complete len:506 (+),score=112.16 gnl/TRDRNA2_/TRDRNA2_153447_c0_seq2:134-1651(+)